MPRRDRPRLALVTLMAEFLTRQRCGCRGTRCRNSLCPICVLLVLNLLRLGGSCLSFRSPFGVCRPLWLLLVPFFAESSSDLEVSAFRTFLRSQAPILLNSTLEVSG